MPRGKYYLVETNLGEANKDRYFNMYNSQDWRREFTVNASERNVVNVYNPEKPNLEITKRVLAEKAGGKHVDLAGLTPVSYTHLIRPLSSGATATRQSATAREPPARNGKPPKSGADTLTPWKN